MKLISSILFAVLVTGIIFGCSLGSVSLVLWGLPDLHPVGWRLWGMACAGFGVYHGIRTHDLGWKS